MKNFLSLFAGVALSSLAVAQNIAISDNFDEYNVNQGIVSQNSEYHTWSYPEYSQEQDALISDDFAYSGTQSLKIVNNNDVVYRFDKVHSGRYSFEFNFYIPDTASGYFNIEHEFNKNFLLDCYFTVDDSLLMRYDHDTINLGTYETNQWNHLVVDVDRTSDLGKVSLYINEELLFEGLSYYSSTGALNRNLDCIDFCGYEIEGISNNLMYIDDFSVDVIVEPLTIANAVVDESTLISFGDNSTIQINNTGEEPLSFTRNIIYDNHETFIEGNNQDRLNYFSLSNDVVQNLTAWKDTLDYRFLLSFKNENSQGLVGKEITHVLLNSCSGYVGDSITVNIYESLYKNINPIGEPVYSETFYNVPAHTDCEFQLSEAYRITGDNFAYGVSFTAPYKDSVIMKGYETDWENSKYLYMGSNAGNTYGTTSIVFQIDAKLSYSKWPEWIEVEHDNFIVGGVDSLLLDVNYLTEQLEDNYTYTAKIKVLSDGEYGNKQAFEIPLTLDLLSSVNDNQKIKIVGYPNPVKSVYNLNSDVEIQNLKLYNQTGQLVRNVDVNTFNYQLNLIGLPAGMYSLQIMVDSEMAVQKIVIE